MLSGRFGDSKELIFEIDLIAAGNFEIPVDAVLDTGFSDWLAVDQQDLDGNGNAIFESRNDVDGTG
jgi:predicted aspartyl protease